jgi:hypothetical protein
MSKEFDCFDSSAYLEPDWEKLGLPSESISVFCMPIKSRPSATCVPVLDDKPRSMAEERREYNRLYQSKYRHLPEAKAVRSQRMKLKCEAERVNPERSHGYTQADADKTKRIAGKPDHRRSA